MIRILCKPGFDKEKSIGMKQLQAHPWQDLVSRLSVGDKIRGLIKEIADNGIFVEIEDGLEGVVDASEISWSKRRPRLFVGQETDALILAVDESQTKVTLSIKQSTENPWEKFAKTHEPGSIVSVLISKITSFGIFADLGDGIEGFIYTSEISGDNNPQQLIAGIKVGSRINVKVVSIDAQKGRIALGLI